MALTRKEADEFIASFLALRDGATDALASLAIYAYPELNENKDKICNELTKEEEKFRQTLKKGEAEKLEQVVTLSENVEAPVTENQKLGSVKFILNGKTLSEIPLLASEEVKKLTFYTSFKRIMNFLACGEKI